jgi:hypothetical protein
MVHIAPPSNWRRRLDLVVGAVLAVLGVVVAVVAVVALHHPNGRREPKAAVTYTVTPSATAKSSASGSAPASGSGSATPSTSGASTSGSASTGATTAGVKSVPLVVLNVTSRTGLAASAAKTFEDGGWTVTSSGNLSNNILSTCAYYDPSDPANLAAATALMAQFPAIKRVKEKFDGLPAGPIVVVLTNDYS